MELKRTFSTSRLLNLALVSRNSLEVVVFTSIREKVSIEVDERSIPSRSGGQRLRNQSVLADKLAVIS
ncbi:unnamed protein product [Arctia plantaginis]|uniref:Uncharacterized protein n=1 Tax=Arctia plantaginis TaxID=874455 RepID=A0A8S0YWT4_ARCPL|nr:unnamed protein product [Arctia plantaginis]CAB3253494.1 unnamed protein product [Arctia plantaginis]